MAAESIRGTVRFAHEVSTIRAWVRAPVSAADARGPVLPASSSHQVDIDNDRPFRHPENQWF
ncbi:hypothetical protein BTZ20_5498 [Rhodococcus sp. MTM3W5.2]|nr:hypothetical protein BTZ20_5498 [Rhodococcus sp. MTM3W5.2]